jgi:hypothetical protein
MCLWLSCKKIIRRKKFLRERKESDPELAPGPNPLVRGANPDPTDPTLLFPVENVWSATGVTSRPQVARTSGPDERQALHTFHQELTETCIGIVP